MVTKVDAATQGLLDLLNKSASENQTLKAIERIAVALEGILGILENEVKRKG